jgi:uncharacterized protein (TIGR02246 family)
MKQGEMVTMIEEEAIRELQLAYGRHFDAREAQAFADLYTDDAVLVQIDGKEIRTKDKFVKSVINMPPPNGGYHRMLDSQITVDGDEASAICNFQARTATGKDVTGHYEDSYRRTADGWKITRRKVILN